MGEELFSALGASPRGAPGHTLCLGSHHNVWWRMGLGYHVAVPKGID